MILSLSVSNGNSRRTMKCHYPFIICVTLTGASKNHKNVPKTKTYNNFFQREPKII